MKKTQGLFWLLVVAIIVAADQLVKYWSANVLRYQDPQPELWGLIRFTYVENRGAAFSFLQDGRWFFVAATVVVLAGIGWIMCSGKITLPLGVWSMAAVTAGAIGNFIDRLFQGYVVDMIQTLFITFPVFNVADIFLTCGGVALCVYLLWQNPKEPGGSLL